jgi:sulfatase maturation enzyme AslB (radical SAM superfamily)
MSMVRVISGEEVAAFRGAEGAEGEVVCLLDLGLPCNMRCDGCDGRDAPLELSDDAAAGLSQAIVEGARERGASGLALALYGGEPLLDPGGVLKFSARVWRACARAGIDYRGHLLTNGTLLAALPPRVLTSAGVGTIQVTLEGSRRTHDERRRFADGRASWPAIIEGLKYARDEANVVVRAPVGDLGRGVEELVGELEGEGLLDGERALAVYVARPAPYRVQARELVKVTALLARGREAAARC